MDITNNIDKKIEEILYSDSGVPEMWAGSEESIPKDKRIGKLSQLLQESGEGAILENLAQMNIYAMHKKKVYGKDREYFLTVEEMHELTRQYLNPTNKEFK